MFLILSISKASVIIETLAFSRQLSIICLFPLQLKRFLFFMSCNILASKFLGVGIINPQNMLNKCKKKMFLLSIAGAWKEFVIVLKRTLALVCTIVENLTLSLIQSVACIYL